MLSNKQKENYIKAVYKNIRCAKKDKKECLDSFTKSVEDVINQEDDITIEKLENILGKPKEASKELEAAIDPYLVKKFIKKRKIKIALIVVLIASIMIAVWQYAVHYALEPMYFEETSVMSPEEMEEYNENLPY